MASIQTSRQRYLKFRKEGPKKEDFKDKKPEGQEDRPKGPDGKPLEDTPEQKAQKKREAKAKRRKYLKQYAGWIAPYKGRLMLLFTLSLIAAGLDMIGPFLFGRTMDHILAPKTPRLDFATAKHELAIIGGVWLVVLLLARAVGVSRWYGTLTLNNQLTARMRKRVHRRLMHLSIARIHDLKTGKIVSRLSNDVGQSMGLLQQGLLSPLAALVRLVMTMTILYTINWRLALAASAILPPVLWVSLMWTKRVRPIFKSAGEDRNETDARMTETFSGIRVVRSFRREAKEMRDASIGFHTVIRKNLYAHRVSVVVDTFWELLIPVTTLAIIFIGGNLVLAAHPTTTVGQIVSFNAYTGMLLWPMWQIVQSLNQTQQALAAMERVFEVFDMPLERIDPENSIEAPIEVNGIQLDHLTFEYREGKPVLEDINVTVPGGSVVALVGRSGAGKTTLTDLIARFYEPTSGAIRINGIDARQIKLDSYRSMLAVVQQETFLFDGTVRENIAYGRRSAPEDEVIAAAKRANAHAFISELPDGYNTIIGERGVKLSGGQRQRLSIARAILADPRILVLDEATSNLDTESEQLIQNALKELYKSRTTFVIAHRLSTVTHADLILVLERGKVVEQGTHLELMARRGTYAEMVDRQRQFAFEEEQAFGAA
ncbi:MAG: ABC transporter ATP-binding protein [Tepidisphaeraceae bacterium]